MQNRLTDERPRPTDEARHSIRVLHVITGLGVGGAESMLASLVRADSDELAQQVVSLVPNGFHTAELRRAGVRVTELSVNHLSHALVDVLRLAKVVRDERPDVVQGWMYHGNIAALMAVRLSGRASSTRLVWGIRCSDREASSEPLLLRAVIAGGAPLARFTDVLVANSSAGLDYHLHRGYHAPHYQVIHNGIDTNRFRPDPRMRGVVRAQLGIGDKDVVVAHVARLHPMKDHATFVEAMRALPRVRALAVGAGTESIPDLPNVLRLGRRSDVAELLTASDLIVSTSAYGEGFSNAIAEGMAAGLVPITTDVGDARTIVGDIGDVLPIRSPSLVREAVDRYCRLSPTSLAARGTQARQRIVANFSLPRAIDAFKQLYLRLAPERTRA